MRRILFIFAVFLAAMLALRLAGLTFAGPLAIALACGAAWLLMRRDGDPRAALGLARPARIGRTLLAGVGCMFAGYFAAIVATLLATQVFGWPPAQTGRIAELVAQPQMLLLMIAISWITAAFGEELLFRGFLQSQLRAVFGPSTQATVGAVLVQAAAFGASHAYQGATGILLSGAIGATFGALYLRTRSLWPLVIGHGLIDTISLLALHAGVGAQAGAG